MNLIELAGPYPATLPPIVGYDDQVKEWSLAGNDRYKDCVFAGLANFNDLVWAVSGNPMVMSEAEAERFYAVETGFDPGNAATDKGAVLRRVIAHWCENGWPGDSELKPIGSCDLRPDELPVATHMLGGWVGWAMLPSNGRGGYDFVGTDREGDYAHALFGCRATLSTLRFVTWAGEINVTRAWWAKYGREAFGIRHPAWRIPGAAPAVA